MGARLVKWVEDYHCYSALSYIKGVKDLTLSNDLPLLRDDSDWREYLATLDDEIMIKRLRKRISTGFARQAVNYL